MWGASTVVETVVPLLAAASFALIAPASLITLDALTYVASALLIRAVVRPLSDPARRPNAPLSRRALVADVREGLSFLWRHTTVRSMTLVAATQSVAGGAFMGQLIPWAATSLHVREGNWRLGVLFATWGIGVLLATVFVPRLVRRVGAARVTLLILPFSAVLCALTALSANWVSGSIALLFWGAAYMGVVLNTITYRQQVTPEPLMSRVNTTGRMLSFGLGSPIGALLGGAVAQLSQPRNGILAGASVTVVGVSVAWLSPLRREGVQPAIVPV
jgi:predicted MFS family arabinose efflux permease